ncbi:hypothetical protein Rrhod_1660 [Rhodococcus rhodnii LMG 5362]|uniref:Uncharacterized protein n=1 Tax=Rhodococcus rhodnii LMG 5362 TaxID=1273125 RepID=R7WP36_9NOCA|nr:hypothetical protein Rrhod_1660 [Rhodococcus rhodnii LMG 5362]
METSDAHGPAPGTPSDSSAPAAAGTRNADPTLATAATPAMLRHLRKRGVLPRVGIGSAFRRCDRTAEYPTCRRDMSGSAITFRFCCASA